MELDEWLQQLKVALDLPPETLDPETVAALLDLTRDCAHEVERVAAPLSSYLVGVAVGRGRGELDAVTVASEALMGPASASTADPEPRAT